MFKEIYIDTITACNRRCFYCPNSKYVRGLVENKRTMKRSMFEKIINELSDIDFQGNVSPNFYGEPLLDDRIADFVSYIRKKLPRSNINLYTNGDLLDLEKYKLLSEVGVSDFKINYHYSANTKKIKEIIDFQEKNNNYSKISYKKISIFSNRGGLIKLDGKIKKTKRCNMPSFLTGVDCDGNVLVCCHDYFSKVVMGNVKNEKLIDIWEKDRYKKLRDEIARGDFKLEMCKKCEYINDIKV